MMCHAVKTGTGNERKLQYARTQQLHNVVTLLGRKRAPGNQCVKGSSLRGIYALHQVIPARAAPHCHLLYKILLMTFHLLLQTLLVTAYPQYWSLFITHHPLHRILLMTVHSLYRIQLVTCHPLYPVLLTTECPNIVSDPIYECPHTETNPAYDTLSTAQGPSCDFHFPVPYSIYECLSSKVQNKMQS
jgi:hypothetical protein